ncbi:TIGR02301 family protein [Rhodoblastus sp.]
MLALALLAGALGGTAPARAQFFFPFFDNRPTTAPDLGTRHRRHRDSGIVDLRHKAKPHRKKSQAADKNAPPDAAKQKAAASAPGANPAPPPEGPPPPYEPRLLRLSEIMGALSYLQPLCGASGAANAPWRGEMEKLMNAENAGPSRREKLAGAFNRGLRGYEFSYHACTPGARLVSARFLDEGARIAHDISTRYRAN